VHVEAGARFALVRVKIEGERRENIKIERK